MFGNMRGITVVSIILAVLAGAMLVGGCNLNQTQDQGTDEENLYLALTKGEDGLWEVESYGDIGELIGVAVTYTTGPPYPGAGTFNADLFVKTRFVDVFGEEYEVALMLGNLNVSEGVESTVEYPFGPVIGIGVPKKIGVRLHDKQDAEIKRVEAIVKPYPPDPY